MNATHTNSSPPHCIHNLFEAQAEQTPDAPAVVYRHQTMTYADLNRRANQLAHYLQKQGVSSPEQPETLIGICTERSSDMIIGLLGILKAGAAYLPLDPTYPPERLAFILENAQINTLLTQQTIHHAQNLPAQIINLDTDWSLIASEKTHNTACMTIPTNLAYVIYTSGSTGKPKGVAIEHRGVINLIHFYQAVHQVTPEDRMTQIAGPAFDATVWEIWPCLTAGASLYIPDDDIRLSSARLVEWEIANHITISFLPTPLAEAVLDESWPPDAALRLLQTGGDALRKWPRMGLPFTLINNYGPTENTVVTTWAALHPGESTNTLPPIGRPMPNHQVYILNNQMEPVPVGEPGELYIGGVGLARGYLNRPGLTAEKFVPHPFSSQPGSRLYKTGDLVRCRPDDHIEFLGRNDHQVKIRGFRIELNEIESVLLHHPAVREAAVLVHEDRPGEKYLVAYVAPRERALAQQIDLRGFLLTSLPTYMVPSYFVWSAQLPLTPNGKIDRQALSALQHGRFADTAPFVAPRSATEKTLAAIWADVLRLPQVSIYDNFIALGGHSLLATRIITRIRHTCQVELPLSTIFEAATIAALAEQIDQFAGEPAFPPIQPVSRHEALPLSFAQERVWFLNELNPGNIAYNAQLTIRLTGQLHLTTLEKALTEIVRRHEIFRTTFPAVDGRPQQVIHPPFAVHVAVIDLQTVPIQEREVAAERFINDEMKRPFNLTQLPLARWSVVRLAADDHVLIQVEHHFVHDGWSIAVLLHELKTLYTAFTANPDGQPTSPLPEPSIQYADFAAWQRQWMQGETLTKELAYWQQRLADAPPSLNLPTDYPRPEIQSLRGAAHRMQIPPPLARALRAFNRREGVTLFMTLLGAFKTLLWHYSGQTDILVGSGVANRRLRQSEELIGMIVNTIILRTDLSGEPTFREVLHRVRATTLETYNHQDLPIEKLVEALHIERDLSHNPLVQVMFSFHDSAVPEVVLPGVRGEITERNNGSAKVDLNLIVIPRAEQRAGQQPGDTDREEAITILWEYSTDLFAPATIARMVEAYVTLLEQVLDNPDQPLSMLRFALVTSPFESVNGYVERPARQRPFPLERSFVAPRTPTERILVEIWTAVLSRDDISVQDNFFAIGGHSLLAAQMAARLRAALQVDLPLRVVFQTATLAELAVLVDESPKQPQDDALSTDDEPSCLIMPGATLKLLPPIRSIVPPRTPVETKLADIWSVVLQLQPISVQDNFFAVGGHSLLATQVVSRVRELFAVDLSVRTLFETPILADFATVIAEAQQREPQPGIVTLQQNDWFDKQETDALLARLDQLSEAELDILLQTIE